MDQAVTRAAGATPSTTTPAAAARRSWAILLTSANHGVVGPLGSTFPHAGEKHERVVVVEVPAGAGAPSDEVSLVLRTASAMGAGANPALEEQRIWQLYQEAQDQGASPRGISPTVHFARAIEREVAAQAGQVAVPEGWKLVPEQPTHPMVAAGGRAQLNADIGTQSNSLRIAKVAYAAMLAAAPSAPAVAQQAPAPGQAEIEWSHDVQERLIASGDGESDEARGLMAEAASLLAAITGRPTPSPAKESK